jgi:hypothetical protein
LSVASSTASPGPPDAELDQLYLRLSHFYRAECFYELGDYKRRQLAYDAAALRYQTDPEAMDSVRADRQLVVRDGQRRRGAHVQRARPRLLGKMPADAFEQAGATMSKQNWEQWLKWTKDAGMFRPGPAPGRSAGPSPGPALAGSQEPAPGQ